MPEPLCVSSSLAGKHILVTGGSGFLGKVFIAMLLQRVPNIGRIYVFMRPKVSANGRARFETVLNTSPVFRELHETYGAGFDDYLASRLEVVEGDLGKSGLGFERTLGERLMRDVHLVVHSAGLVDFNPDLGKALDSNVSATLNVAQFVSRCDDARLLHISTSYVAGIKAGFISEQLNPHQSPNGRAFDAEAEREGAGRVVAEIREQYAQGSAREAAIARRVKDTLGVEASAQSVRNGARREVREALKEALSDAGMDRAKACGFPNTYTYTKFMAEALLSKQRGKLRYALFRPTIVESAISFPFPSWNESFNGSAPLAYVMGSWHRMIPARPSAPFDVIPVDEVCKAMAICSAALIRNCHSEVYQIGTSDRNLCTVGRAAELIALSHRRHYRERERGRKDRVVKSRWDAVLVHPDHLFGVQGVTNGAQFVRDVLEILPDKLRDKVAKVERKLDDLDGKLADIRKMVELYMPFMYDGAYVFESKAIDRHPALDEDFAFAPEKLDWRDYWLNIHMPGLRRYAFPLIEGKRPERYRALHRATLPPAPTITDMAKLASSEGLAGQLACSENSGAGGEFK